MFESAHPWRISRGPARRNRGNPLFFEQKVRTPQALPNLGLTLLLPDFAKYSAKNQQFGGEGTNYYHILL
jgi:hypothetical protein